MTKFKQGMVFWMLSAALVTSGCSLKVPGAASSTGGSRATASNQLNVRPDAPHDGAGAVSGVDVSSLLAMTDGELVDRLMNGGVGQCFISGSCPSCACAHYFKSNVVPWANKGWPVNPESHDSTGCISEVQWGGYTPDMATHDWIHNGAAQARNAISDPSNPCALDQSAGCPSSWLGHNFHDSYVQDGRIVCDYDGTIGNAGCISAGAMMTEGSHGIWCQKFTNPTRTMLLSLQRI